jgi:hypothetical protein
MKRRELQALSLDLKWTSEPVFADFGPHMDQAHFAARSEEIEREMILRLRAVNL